MFKALAATLGAGLALTSATAPAWAQENSFYQGKVLNLLVPFGTGGGTDVWARYMAEFLPDHIPGSPTVLVENRPGGGSIIGANHFSMMVEPDGETLLVTSGSTIQPYLLKDEAVRYNLGEMRPIAANPVGAIFYVNPSTGIDSAEALLNTEEPLYYGGISATGNDLVMLMIFDLLDMDVQSVMGYDGKGPIRVAYERGELNVDYQVTPAYNTNVQPMVDQGIAQPIFTFGMIGPDGDVISDQNFPDLPTVKDLYLDVHGQEPSGIEWEAYKTFLAAGFGVQKILWAKRDTPEEAITALEAGVRGVAEDPEAQARAEEVLGGYELLVGADAVAAARGIIEVNPEVLAFGRAFLADHGYE